MTRLVQVLLKSQEYLSSSSVLWGVLSKKSFWRHQRGNQNPKSKKDRQHNDQKKKDKRINNDQQNIQIKLKIE